MPEQLLGHSQAPVNPKSWPKLFLDSDVFIWYRLFRAKVVGEKTLDIPLVLIYNDAIPLKKEVLTA